MKVAFQAEKLDDIETQLRTAFKAYILTRDTSFLTPIYTAESGLENIIKELTYLTRDNSLQQKSLKELNVAMKIFLDNSFSEAEIYSNPSSESISKRSVPTEVTRSRIKMIIGAIKSEEASLLAKRLAYNDHVLYQFNLLINVISGSLLIFTLVLLFTARKIFLQIKEKDSRAEELVIANKTLHFENKEKVKRADELLIAGKELLYQNMEKQDRAAELLLANKELLYQNGQKRDRAAELILANQELSYQNQEKEYRAIELKETIGLLNESEIFNRGVLNSLSSQIAVIDRSGKLIAVNDSWNKFAAKNKQTTLQRTAVGSNFFDVCTRAIANYDKTAAKAMWGIIDVFDDSRSSFYMEYACAQTENPCWFGMRAIKFEGDGNLVVVSHLDITERRMAEQNLLVSEASLKEAQAMAHMGNYEMDLMKGSYNWSDEMFTILGLNRKLTVPSMPTFLQCIHSDDIDMVRNHLATSLRTLKARDLEFRFVHSDGSLRYGKVISEFELNSEGKALRLFGVFQDVTASMLAVLEKTTMLNELTTRNRDLEQFAYIVSHNLRAPIANIIGASDALKDPDLDSEDKLVLKEGINISVRKLDVVVTDLNLILEIRAGANDRKELVDLDDLVMDIRNSIEDNNSIYDINIVSDFSEENMMFALKPYLYSIFYNLISNSVKYRKTEEHLQILIKSKMSDEGIELSFTDNGLGIDLVKKGDEVFGMYKRFHPGIEGKGMGLFMVKTQVEALGGKIDVESAPNAGCKFSILLPNT